MQVRGAVRDRSVIRGRDHSLHGNNHYKPITVMRRAGGGKERERERERERESYVF